MPEMKKQSKQWIQKGQPGPIKARVHASRTKQIAVDVLQQQRPNLHPLHAQGLHHQCQLHPQGLGQVLGAFEEEARDGPAGMDFHWDNSPFHTAASVKKWFANHSI
jgi:hypothetical protein